MIKGFSVSSPGSVITYLRQKELGRERVYRGIFTSYSPPLEDVRDKRLRKNMAYT